MILLGFCMGKKMAFGEFPQLLPAEAHPGHLRDHGFAR